MGNQGQTTGSESLNFPVAESFFQPKHRLKCRTQWGKFAALSQQSGSPVLIKGLGEGDLFFPLPRLNTHLGLLLWQLSMGASVDSLSVTLQSDCISTGSMPSRFRLAQEVQSQSLSSWNISVLADERRCLSNLNSAHYYNQHLRKTLHRVSLQPRNFLRFFHKKLPELKWGENKL